VGVSKKTHQVFFGYIPGCLNPVCYGDAYLIFLYIFIRTEGLCSVLVRS